MRFQRSFSKLAHEILDSYHYTNLLRYSSDLKTLKKIHTKILISGLHKNPFLSASLISKYTQQNPVHISIARKLFDNLPQPDSFLYNLLIQSYAASPVPSDAFSIYAEMLRRAVPPNSYSFSFVLTACAASGSWKTGGAVHAHAVRARAGGDLFINNALIALYGKCGRVETARKVFDRMIERDIVSWNSIISGLGQNGFHREALEILHRMLLSCDSPDSITLVSVLPACATISAVAEGMWIHNYALRKNIAVDAAIGSGLIEMYVNCGRLGYARKVFDEIPLKNIVVYNSMIKAYGAHGRASAALELFSEMMIGGTKPDSICFASILSACSHSGLIKEGLDIFDMMEGEYGVEKTQVHYACIVDMLGRAGEFEKALEFIEGMPFEPGRDVFGALLGACKVYKNVELGVEIAKRLLVVDGENAGRYATLAKFYEDSQRYEDAASVRKGMKERGVRKQLGCSMVEVATKFHMFGVEDESHIMSCEIFDVVKMLHRNVDEEEDFVFQIC